MPPKTKFNEGEKVLCFHGPLLYEAKCVKVEVKDKHVRYYIHYNGWNKNWDEWVPESRVLKHNEAGLQKQKELMSAHGYGAVKKASKGGRKPEKKLEKEGEKKEEKERPEKEEKKEEKEKKGPSAVQSATKKKVEKEEKVNPAAAVVPAVPSTSGPASDRSSSASSPTPEPKRKRPRVDVTTVETEEVYMSRIEVKIKIPEELKPWLVDDWDLITRQKMLMNLPCRNTVDNIVDEYVKTKTSKTNVNKDAVIETMAGVRDYFNIMLGTQLLYKFERPQYSEIMTDNTDKPMSALYGATHLLRLFVRLGQMLAYTSLGEKCTQTVLTHIHDFLKYMLKNSASLFNHADYSIAPPEYHRKAI